MKKFKDLLFTKQVKKVLYWILFLQVYIDWFDCYFLDPYENLKTNLVNYSILLLSINFNTLEIYDVWIETSHENFKRLAVLSF